MEHLAAKREAAVEHLRAANSGLRNRIDGLAQELATVMRDRDKARSEAAKLADQDRHLRGQLGADQAKLQGQQQFQQAAQKQQAQNAALTPQLAKLENGSAAEEVLLAQGKASVEETARELAQLAGWRGKGSVQQDPADPELGGSWRELSQIDLPLLAYQSGQAAGNASGTANVTISTPSDLGVNSVAAFEQGLRSAGVDVKRILSQLSDNHAEGGPFVPPPKAGDGSDNQSGPTKLAALAALARTLPLAAPLSHYEIGSRFGPRIDPFNHRPAFHTGIDMDAPYSSPVYATAPGIVIYAGWLGDYGKVVEIDHGFGIVTLYAHLRRCLVAVNQTVPAQAEIGLVGTTGRSTGPHVHYEVRVDGQPQDPEKFLNLERLLPAAVAHPLIPVAGGSAESSH